MITRMICDDLNANAERTSVFLIGRFTNSRAKRRRKHAKKYPDESGYFLLLAEWTGLEPATPGVTGRYSNQLNYHSKITRHASISMYRSCNLVGAEGIEPPTFAL